MPRRLFTEDLQHTLDQARPALAALRGARLLVTGGTGFFGRWLVETFQHANRELRLDAHVTILSRDPAAYLAGAPHVAGDPAVELVRGDVTTLDLPGARFTHVVHAATATRDAAGALTPLTQFDTAVAGTRRVLDVARASGATRVLYCSSGAVYGPQPATLTHVPEDYPGAPSPLDPATGYGQGKRAAEYLCSACHAETGLAVVVARCFAFVGPHLPLDQGFAIGNFIRDALRGGPILVQGDGTPRRSYLYAADLAAWLWTLLVSGVPARAYNVGSDEDVSIAELAHEVARVLAPGAAVHVAGARHADAPVRRYVPSTARARSELGLAAGVAREEAIRRTGSWYGTPEGSGHGGDPG